MPSGPSAVRRATGVEDLEAGRVNLVQRYVRVTEDHRVSPGEPSPQSLEPPDPRARVVNHRHSPSSQFELELPSESSSDRVVVDVAVDADDLAIAAQLVQHGKRGQISGMDDQFCRLQPLDARVGKPPRSTGEVGVRDDRDEHVR